MDIKIIILIVILVIIGIVIYRRYKSKFQTLYKMTPNQLELIQKIMNSICYSEQHDTKSCEIESNNAVNSMSDYIAKHGYSGSNEDKANMHSYIISKYPHYKWSSIIR